MICYQQLTYYKLKIIIMNKKEIFAIFEAITTSGQSIFVNDFDGWGERAEIPAYGFTSAMEGNGVKSHATDEEYIPQCGTIRRGNHLEVQIRQNGQLIKRFTLGELFPDNHLVIVTSGEALRWFAPIFALRSELIDWLMQVHEYCILRQNQGNPVPWYWESEMVELAKFFYRNNPDKENDKSIYDYLTDI